MAPKSSIAIPSSLLPDPPTLPSSTSSSKNTKTSTPKPPTPIPNSTTHQSQSRTSLQTHARILQMIHYRNKNQHRRAHWYRAFSTFRREVIRVCAILEIPLDITVPSTPSKLHSFDRTKEDDKTKTLPRKTRERLLSQRIHESVNERIRHWVDHGLVEKWHTAFTHIVTTTQFSAMGLCLVACLARTCKVVGVTGYLEQSPGVTVGTVGENESVSGRVDIKDFVKGLEGDGDGGEANAEVTDGVDLGVKVERDKGDGTREQRPATNPQNPAKKRRVQPGDDVTSNSRLESDKITKKKKKKIRKEGTDAIDDLFEGLV